MPGVRQLSLVSTLSKSIPASTATGKARVGPPLSFGIFSSVWRSAAQLEAIRPLKTECPNLSAASERHGQTHKSCVFRSVLSSRCQFVRSSTSSGAYCYCAFAVRRGPAAQLRSSECAGLGPPNLPAKSTPAQARADDSGVQFGWMPTTAGSEEGTGPVIRGVLSPFWAAEGEKRHVGPQPQAR